MKTILLILSFLMFCITDFKSQSYMFSVNSEIYTDLVGSTSLNNGVTWDDPEYAIPIGFQFEYFGNPFTELFIDDFMVGGALSTDTSQTGVIPVLNVFGADIIDRASDTVNFSGQLGSLSSISYLLDGTAGNQILKIEWNNVGFWGEINANNASVDYTNFQLWLYEGSNDIEIRFGATSVVSPNLSYDGGQGSSVTLFAGIDMGDYSLSPGSINLSGDPLNPSADLINGFGDILPLTGTIPDSTVYKFSTGLVNQEVFSLDPLLLTYPNPTSSLVYIRSDPENTIQNLMLFGVDGKLIQGINTSESFVDLSNYTAGVYTLKIFQLDGSITVRKIMKFDQ